MSSPQPPGSEPQLVSFLIINKDDRGVVDTLRALTDIGASGQWASEIVLVDASQGRLDDVRDAFGHVRWIPFTTSPGHITIPEQRNVSIQASRGSILVFIDASCRPDDQWLERLLGPIRGEDEAVVAGGHRSSAGGGIRDEAAAFIGTRRYVDEAPTINLAVRRDVLDRVGGFDESFEYGSDVDLTWRITDAGYRIRYVPDAIVRHDWGSTRAELRRSYRYGKARMRLYLKHQSRRRGVLRRDPPLVAYPLFLLLSPILVLYPWLVGVLAVPLVKNARHRPFSTVAHHLVYATGALATLGSALRG